MATAQCDSFPWIELAAFRAGGGMDRRYARADNRDDIEGWRGAHCNRDIFVSVCRFAESSRTSPASCGFYMDIDAANLEDARQDTLRAATLIQEHVGVPEEMMDVRFSGKKGFHLLVPPQVFGEPNGFGLLSIWRSLAHRLYREGVTHIDLHVYQQARLLRMPNTINSKSNLWDIPVDLKELRDLGLEFVLDIARQPRQWDSMAAAGDSARAAQWLFNARQWHASRQRSAHTRGRPREDRGNGWRLPPCVRRIEREVLPDGIRHAVYFLLARLYSGTGMAPEEAMDRLQEIDQRNPIRDPDYIERIVRMAKRYSVPRRCPHSALESFCDPARCFMAEPHLATPGSELKHVRVV